MPYSVLFVCTANINRSPLAAALLRLLVKDEDVDWRIASAGTWARDGLPAAPQVQALARARRADLSEHRAQMVTRTLLESHRLILVMEQGHKEALRAEFPDLAGRVYLLSEMAGRQGDIVDPIGGSEADYQDAVQEIDVFLRQGLARIRELAAEPGAAA